MPARGPLETPRLSRRDNFAGEDRRADRRYDHEHPDPLHVSRETFTVRDQFQRLLEAVSPDRPFDLLADLRQRSCRAEIVAAFLAVLELAHLSLVRFHQTAGGEILIYRTGRELQVHELEAIEE